MQWNSHSVKMNHVTLLITPWSGFYTLDDIWRFSESEVEVTHVLIVQSLDCIKYQCGKDTTCVHWDVIKKIHKLATARKLLKT